MALPMSSLSNPTPSAKIEKQSAMSKFIFGDKNKKLVSFVMPLSIGSGVAGATKNLITGGVNILKRQFTNPFAGTSIKIGLQNIGKRMLGYSITGAGFSTAYNINRQLSSGHPFDWEQVAKSAARGATFGINPFGAVLGFGVGEGEKELKIIKDYANSKPSNDIMNKLPTSNLGNPTVPLWNGVDAYTKSLQDLLNRVNTTQLQPNINLVMSPPQTNISMPSPSYGFSPSISAGGGMGEILPLMLLLAGGAGLGGYVIGKRKKKKYKRRKKHK